MSIEENLPPHVKYWLSPDTKHDCYFIVGPDSGPNKRIGSFKAFLIGYSEPFRVMLQDGELKEQEDILIVDIKPNVFTYFLKCLYLNCENITKENISVKDCVDLLYVADKYLVTYLKEKLVDCLLHALQNTIKLDDIIIVLSNPVVLHEKRLEEKLSETIPSKILQTFSSPLFLSIPSDSLLWILKLDDVGVNEITLWKELLKWAIHNTNSEDGSILRNHLLNNLKFIRFCTMSSDDFCKEVIETDILTPTEVYEICKSLGSGKPPNLEFICNNTILRRNSNNKPESTYSFCVNNISHFSGELESPKFTLQELEWSILVEKNEGYLSFYLAYQGTNETSDKQPSVTVELVLINNIGVNLSVSFTNVFDNDENTFWGYDQFCSWEEIMNPSKKYVVYDSITLVVHINKTTS